MKFWRAFKIFLFLLKAKEWFVIADNADKHIIDADITTGKVLSVIQRNDQDVINQESLLRQAKELLN
jgi:hypothetical protein